MVALAPAPASNPAVTVDLVLYDGTCGLCAKAVRFILRNERDHDLQFAPLQGETTAALRARYSEIPQSVDTVVYVHDGTVHLRSKAFLHLSKHLRAPWSWAYAFRWFPAFVLNVGYRLVAALRYRMFGRVDSCELPSPEQRVRFLP